REDGAIYFFQAEDGIRDFHVTGVQTCALPIFLATDLSMVQRRSNENFADARKTPEHREALYALRERRAPRYHDPEYMADMADKEIGRASCRGRGESAKDAVARIKMRL